MKSKKSEKAGRTIIEWLVIAAIIVIALILVGMFINRHIVGNKQIIDFKQNFNAAYIKDNSNIWTRVKVKAWNDYENSDSVQIITSDGKPIYTHLSNVKLVRE